MPRFPKKEAEIFAFADQLANGMLTNVIIFPNPPVHPFVIFQRRAAYQSCRDDAMSAAAAAEQSVAGKDAALANLIDLMKTNLRYAENTAGFDDALLSLIGWSAKKSPAPLQPPGQTFALTAVTQGAGSLTLSFRAPSTGGRVAAYRIVRSIDEGMGGQENVATAVTTEVFLKDQPLRQKLQYKVIAINKAGEGMESNTVEVVL